MLICRSKVECLFESSELDGESDGMIEQQKFSGKSSLGGPLLSTGSNLDFPGERLGNHTLNKWDPWREKHRLGMCSISHVCLGFCCETFFCSMWSKDIWYLRFYVAYRGRFKIKTLLLEHQMVDSWMALVNLLYSD